MDMQELHDELVDLGVASVETKGFPIPENDIVGVGLQATGLSGED